MNPFGSIAAGYARSRPPVHARVLALALGGDRFERALDVGCGAGVSTTALEEFAAHLIGIEPAESMLAFGAEVAPGAEFVCGAAEALPFGDSRFDLLTAAGSLNYADAARFFPEAKRVMRQAGVLVVYDFGPGKSFMDSSALDDWFAEFMRRFPAPRAEARELHPEILKQEAQGFRMLHASAFEIALELDPEFYIDYVMTETNVAAAVRTGTAEAEIRKWCERTLTPVWEGRRREVVFRGYFACLAVVVDQN